MCKKLFTALITALWCTYLHAQIPPGCGSEIIPAEDCQSACVNCNFNGQIWHLSPSAQKNDYLIQLDNMPSGVYWVEIRDDEGVYWGEIVVQR